MKGNMTTLNNEQKSLVEGLFAHYKKDELTRSEINDYIVDNKIKNPSWLKSNTYKIARGVYRLPINGDISPVVSEPVSTKTETTPETNTVSQAAYVVSSLTGNIVPTKDPVFVPWGHFKDIKSIVTSKQFYPIFITGLSGNGKTMNVQQACAVSKRECIRVNITIETDEDDLLGGYRLQDGQTVWQNGPVIEAMERGAILLLDEIDLASNKILCLQPVLEGKGLFLKKIGRFVQPKAGFNIVATANTKGKGSDDGRFIGTNVLNEAFLERFPVTFEQAYPAPAHEIKILNNVATTLNVNDTEFCKRLVDWADIIRKTFYDGGIEEIISTRRLVHILRAYAIFKNKENAIKVCINRFDDETKQSFLELYDKVDADFEITKDETPMG